MLSQTEIQRLYDEKKRKKIKTRDIAKMVGCSDSLLSKWFKGKCNIAQDKEFKVQQIIKNATPNYKLILERYDVRQ